MDSSAIDERYRAAVEFLFQRIDYERAQVMPYGDRALKLDRMIELLDRLDNPHHGMRIVHVAGTKGKGSTSAMIAAALSAAGNRTGLFTSPHLDRVEERMAIDACPAPPLEFVEAFDRLRPAVEVMDAAGSTAEGPPTYFELTTALALVHFWLRRVDAAVLEVGLGGRLDSTNVCAPAVSVITSISFDHMRQLGNTLAKIAREKAGIIKRGVPVVSGVTEDEPREVIREVAREQDAPRSGAARDFTFDYDPPRAVDRAAVRGRLTYRSDRDDDWSREPFELALLGRHQAANAAVALATLAELARQDWPIDEPAARRGLASVRWPARVEVVSRRPTIIVDAAHNDASVAALVETLDESFAAARRVLVFATTQEKPVRGMLEKLLPRFDRVIFTRYLNNPRGVPPAEMAAVAREIGGGEWTTADTPHAAWNEVLTIAGENDLVCITGSFFIAAEMRAEMTAQPPRALDAAKN